MEDQKIRHYKVEDRSPLRKIESSTWEAVYKKYLADLECPVKNERKEEELEWLLTFSVALNYQENLAKYNAEDTRSQSSAPKVTSENPLDNMDFHSPDFIQGVNKLASIFQIDHQPDHLLTLKAVAKLVTTRLSEKAIKDPSSVVSQVNNKDLHLAVMDSNLGSNKNFLLIA